MALGSPLDDTHAARRDSQPIGLTIRDPGIVEMDILADPERLSRIDLAILH